MNNIVLILTSFLFFSCVVRNNSLDELFEKTEFIKHAQSISGSDYLMGSVGKVLLVDTILITLDYNNSRFFHVFDIKNMKYVDNLGNRGQGPNEFIHPTSLIYFSEKEFLTFDANDNSLKQINLDSLVQGVVSYKKALSFSSISNMAILPTKFNTFVGFGVYTSNMFKLIDHEGNDMEYYIDFPIAKSKIDKKMDNRNIAMGYQGIIAVNPEKDKFVYASYYGTIYAIFSISDQAITQQKLVIYDYPQFVTENTGGSISSPLTKETISGFTDVSVTEEYIYMLYSGKNISEERERSFEGETIYVLDWKGNPILKYSLDLPISSIAVSADNQKLFALSQSPEPVLVEFDINL